MDLLAYAQIEEYENLLTSNHIKIPRLRGTDSCEGMKPWFIEKVDDYFDSTYCDIYVRISR